MKKVHKIILAAFVVITASVIVLVSYLTHQSSSSDAQNNGTQGKNNQNGQNVDPSYDPSKPVFYCPLDGLPTTEENGTRRPVAVMIENHPSARPQSSLTKACTVYETVAEGGITRFMAIFVHNDTDKIGPVRSAREYFVDLAKQYDALYSHCGGPAYIYDIIKSYGVADLDEFLNKDSYWRVNYRRKPHNLYTSTEKLRKRANTLDYSNDVFYQKPNFKDEAPLNGRPLSASININFSRPEYKVHYIFDRVHNEYKRFMGGNPHIDAESKKQITVKNVVVQYAPISSIANDPKGRMQVGLIGTGRAIVFRDGRAAECKWMRQSLDMLTRFYDSDNQEVKFNRGQTWIELVDEKNMPVSYQ